jgi:hypothetical protein
MKHGALSFLANTEHTREAEARSIRSISTMTPPQRRPTTTTISQALLAEEATLAVTARSRALSVGMEVTLTATAMSRAFSIGMEVALPLSSQ